jgi:hypothetical protein
MTFKDNHDGTVTIIMQKPLQKKPLSDEEIGLITSDARWCHVETPLLADFARAIEKAHGIEWFADPEIMNEWKKIHERGTTK